MKKREFKIGDKVIIKGIVTSMKEDGVYPLDVTFCNSLILSLTKDGRYYEFDSEPSLFHASDIKPVKKDDVTYEYRYLIKCIYLNLEKRNKDWWRETLEYHTSKKEVFEYYKLLDKNPDADSILCQRITSTKRVRK